MAWRDRDYNRGAEAAREFFGNPATILSFAVPVGRWFGSRVTLHFWLLLQFLFLFIQGLRGYGSLLAPTVACTTLLAVLLVHEFGHRFFARLVRGHHEEFVLWPFGGMNPVVSPPTPGAMFVANIGGVVANLVLAIVASVAVGLLLGQMPLPPLPPSPVHVFGWVSYLFAWPSLMFPHRADLSLAISIPLQIAVYSWGLVLTNLFLPYYWFDGANILQSILWRPLGLFRAITVTCITGLVLAVPMFLLALTGPDLFGMILWIFLFSSSWVRLQQVRSAGPEALEESIGFASTYDEYPPRRRRRRRSWFRSAAKKAAKEQAEQAKIDAILAKVHDKGLHSLTWWEKRTLRKATERQRQQDLAERL